MSRRLSLWIFVMVAAAALNTPENLFAAVGGNAYSITGQSVIDGSEITDVYYFNANQTFNTDSTGGHVGEWSELNLFLFSIYVADIDLTEDGSPLPVSASTIGFSAGTQISGIIITRIGPLTTLTGIYGGEQIP